MSTLTELEHLNEQRPTPPPTLYKYLAPERASVLGDAEIRFTPPLNTNDLFEVRHTFDLIAGPKMVELFRELAPQVDLEGPLRNALDESGLKGISNEEAKALISHFGGGEFEATTRGLLDQFLNQLPTLMNTPENISGLLERVASGQLLLSLSDRSDSSPMWAHYAANSAGFVIAFNTDSAFFKRGELGELQGLHKVAYLDEKIPEILENPYGALISKKSDWSYEHEWRLYAKSEQVSRIIEADRQEIHLVQFPRQAVQRVVLGTRASRELENELREILARSYPDVPLMRVRADRMTVSLVEEQIWNG